jgi:transcriptional regulator with XRE-family HTH domain
LLLGSLYAILKVSIWSSALSILKVSIRQIKAARALLGWSQSDLAGASGISEPTIKRLEANDGEIGGRADTAEKIQVALESAGVEFTNGGQPGVRMKMRKFDSAMGSDKSATHYYLTTDPEKLPPTDGVWIEDQSFDEEAEAQKTSGFKPIREHVRKTGIAKITRKPSS